MVEKWKCCCFQRSLIVLGWQRKKRVDNCRISSTTPCITSSNPQMQMKSVINSEVVAVRLIFTESEISEISRMLSDMHKKSFIIDFSSGHSYHLMISAYNSRVEIIKHLDIKTRDSAQGYVDWQAEVYN